MEYISYVRADIPVLVLFIVGTSILAHHPRSETTYRIQENNQKCCKTDGGFNECETSIMHKDIRDLGCLLVAILVSTNSLTMLTIA